MNYFNTNTPPPSPTCQQRQHAHKKKKNLLALCYFKVMLPNVFIFTSFYVQGNSVVKKKVCIHSHVTKTINLWKQKLPPVLAFQTRALALPGTRNSVYYHHLSSRKVKSHVCTWENPGPTTKTTLPTAEDLSIISSMPASTLPESNLLAALLRS